MGKFMRGIAEENNYHVLVLLYSDEASQIEMYDSIWDAKRQWCPSSPFLNAEDSRLLILDTVRDETGCDFALLIAKHNDECKGAFVVRVWEEVQKYRGIVRLFGKAQVRKLVYGRGKYKRDDVRYSPLAQVRRRYAY